MRNQRNVKLVKSVNKDLKHHEISVLITLGH